MRQLPHIFIGLSFSDFIWMKYLVCFVCFSATLQHSKRIWLLLPAFIGSLKIAYIFSGMEMCLMAEQAVPDVPYFKTTSSFQVKDWNGFKDTMTCSSLMIALWGFLHSAKSINFASWMLASRVLTFESRRMWKNWPFVVRNLGTFSHFWCR